MYTVAINIYVNGILAPYKKYITAEDQETLIARTDEVARTISSSGFFDDTHETDWFFIPRFQIERVEFKIKENETSNEGTNESHKDSET